MLGLDFADTGTVRYIRVGIRRRLIPPERLAPGQDVQIPILLRSRAPGYWCSTPDLVDSPTWGSIAALVTGGGDTALKQTLPAWRIRDRRVYFELSSSLAVDPTGPTLAGFSCGLESTAAWLRDSRWPPHALKPPDLLPHRQSERVREPRVQPGDVSGRFQIGSEARFTRRSFGMTQASPGP